MKHVILGLLLAAGAIASSGENIASIGPDQLECNTISLIESHKNISIVKGAGPKVISIQDMWISSKTGNPKTYTISSYLPNQDGDSVLEATEVSTAIGTVINGVELVLQKKSNFKSGKLTFIQQTPKGTVRGTTSEFTCK